MALQQEHDSDGRSFSQRDVESPFLQDELFGGETGAEWEARLAVLEAENPYLGAFEQQRALTSVDYARDDLEVLSELPLEEQFDPTAVPKDVADALGQKDWPLALKLAIQAGWRNANDLTNLLFFARHPELPPEQLDPKGPNFKQLSAEWMKILNEEVWEAIQASAENTDLVVSGKEVTDHHRSFFRGKSGKRLKQLIEDAAMQVDLNPGLLGTIMMAETRRPQSYLSSEKVSSYHIGADDFYEGRGAIKARVPAYTKVKWDKNQTPIEHYNDAKKPRIVKTILFDSGPAAVLATAVYLKFREVRLREVAAEPGGDFDSLPLPTRFALTRMAMAAGTGGATPFLKDALNRVDIFVREAIPVRPYQTKRNATVRTAQAMHLSDWVFGISVPAATLQPELETFEDFDAAQFSEDEFEDEAEAPYRGMDPERTEEVWQFDSDLEAEGVHEEEYEDLQVPRNPTADAFVADKDGKEYFTTFPQLGDLTIKKATVLTPSNFESLMDHMLASNQKNFVIDAHGDPFGLSMHLTSATKISATKQSLFILRGIEYIRSLMRIAKESDTIWERASGADLDRWRRIVETLHSKTWQRMVGPSWPTEIPQVSNVAAARSIVQSRIASLRDALFPGGIANKQERVDRLINKMLQLQAKGIREIQFRACNIGKDAITLYEFRKFFGADHLCAPDVRSGMGFVMPRIDRQAVDLLAKRPLTQVYTLPSGRFAIHIDISGGTFTSKGVADTQGAVGEWVASHIMANSRYRKGKLPIHFLQTQPPVFALDKDYAAHIKCRSSFWEGAVRANDLEEEEAHQGEEYEPDRSMIGEEETHAQREAIFAFDSREGSDEIESEDESELEEAWDNALEQDAAPQEVESSLFERQIGGGASAVDPFPRNAYVLGLEMNNQELYSCASAVENDPDISSMCGAVADLTGNPELPPFYANNPVDMVYVASLVKIYPMYVAFELRRRVQEQAKDMIKAGLSTSTVGWEGKVFAALEKAWKPKLKAAFPTLPEGFPKLAEIFVLSSTGDVKFAANDPPVTDADLDFWPPNPDPARPPISPEFKTPPGKFRDWMRLMLRWSNNEAASKCIQALSYPYINGVLAAAGFFNKTSKVGLWLSGDYLGHDWLPADGAAQRLSPRWARLQRRKVTNFAGTAFQVARLLTLLAQGRLVDKKSSREMLKIMTGVAGIGSYIRGGLAGAAPPRPFSSIASKIGCGNEVPPPACGFTHDCAIVRVDRGGDPARTLRYVVVAVGGHPNKAKADLRKLVVRFHDCVVARHP